MAVTYEQLVSAGMDDAQARLLASELRARDWTGHPMVVTLAGIAVATLIAVLGWLAISVTDLRTEVTRDIALLRDGQATLQSDVTEILARLPD